MRFHLNLNVRAHIALTKFEKINWLFRIGCFEECISAIAFKFFNNSSSAYMNDIFKPTGRPNNNTANILSQTKSAFS